jgi:hypothetical protein
MKSVHTVSSRAALLAALTVALAFSAQADIVPVTPPDTIVLSTPEGFGVIGAGSYGSFRIESSVTDLGAGVFQYDYLITSNVFNETEEIFEPLPQALSHWILEVSADALEIGDVIIDGSIVTSHEIGETELNDWTADQGNPGMPGTLHGIKFNIGGEATSYSFSFQSYRTPILGSFYAKDGTGNYAYNTYLDDPAEGLRIIVPDTDTIIPEPSTFALLGFGIAGLFARRFRKR